MSYTPNDDEWTGVPPAWEWIVCLVVVVGILLTIFVAMVTGNWLGVSG